MSAFMCEITGFKQKFLQDTVMAATDQDNQMKCELSRVRCKLFHSCGFGATLSDLFWSLSLCASGFRTHMRHVCLPTSPSLMTLRLACAWHTAQIACRTEDLFEIARAVITVTVRASNWKKLKLVTQAKNDFNIWNLTAAKNLTRFVSEPKS